MKTGQWIMKKGRRELSFGCFVPEKGLIKLSGASLIKENHYSFWPGNREFWSIKYVVNSYLPLQQTFVETQSVQNPGSVQRPPDPSLPLPFSFPSLFPILPLACLSPLNGFSAFSAEMCRTPYLQPLASRASLHGPGSPAAAFLTLKCTMFLSALFPIHRSLSRLPDAPTPI